MKRNILFWTIFIVIMLSIITFVLIWINANNKKIEFDVVVTDISIAEQPSLPESKVREEEKRDFYSNPDNYITINYGIKYSSNKKIISTKPVNMGIFFELSYPNELNECILGYTQMKDFGFTYQAGTINTYGITVTLNKNNFSIEEITEMAQDVEIKVTGLENFDSETILNQSK